MSRIEAVSFDLFGTLISYDVWHDGGPFLDDLAARRGIEIEGIELLARWLAESTRLRSGPEFVGLEESLERGLRRVFRDKGLADDVRPWMEGLLSFWRSRPLYDDVLPTLARLPVPACIVSNLGTAHLEAIVTATGLRDKLRFALASEEAGAHKPHPRVFQLAARRLGLAPERILHVGDSNVDDVIGAKRVGFQAAWLNRRASEPPPDFVGDHVIASLTEAVGIVERSHRR